MSTSHPDSKPCAILVVEDSTLIRLRVMEHLSESLPGVSIDGAECIADAVDRFIATDATGEEEQELSPRGSRFFRPSVHLPDVLVLDLELPGCNGINLLRAIKRDHPEVGVVVYTCLGSDSMRRACLSLGADFFVSKGEDIDVLETAVGTLAARHSAASSGEEEKA